MHLVLFDIDGTLISTNGVARHHFADALDEIFQIHTNARTHDFAGKMDTQIYHEILGEAGISLEVRNREFPRFSDRFYERLQPHLHARSITVLPGIHSLLEALRKDDDITLGLLTGNLERGAHLKLAPVGLADYFPFGAFGSDGMFRNELPEIAVRRAREQTGYDFKGKEIVIIGDTPNDIHCGNSLQVKTIAVATGKYSHDALAEHAPDFLFDDCSNTKVIIDAIHTKGKTD